MSALTADIAEVFERLVATAKDRNLAAVRADIRTHLRAVENAAESNALLPVDIAQELAAALEELLDLVPSLDAEAARLVTAAACYFTSEHDAIPDTGDVLGLDDDVQVFNHVVERLGLPERKLDL